MTLTIIRLAIPFKISKENGPLLIILTQFYSACAVEPKNNKKCFKYVSIYQSDIVRFLFHVDILEEE